MLGKRGLRAAATILTASVVITSFAGCGKKEEAKPEQKAETSTTSILASDKPIEIRAFVEDRVDAPFTKDLDVFKELAKRTNVSINWEAAPQGTGKEKYNLVVASGDLPDIMIYKYDDIIKYADKGAFEPLNELIDKNAPNLKKVINQDKNILKTITYSDGKIYVVPSVGALKVSELFFMRKDWLDKLNLKEPDTLDDWYNVLKAFKERDPNGNGKADEIPYSVRSKTANVIPFIQAWGISDEFFIEDGKVKYGPTDPRMKDALTWLNKLYKEGLIDKDYLQNDVKQWQARFTNEVSGAMHDWVSRIDFFNTEVQKVNPKANLQAVLPPKGPTGIRMTRKQQNLVRTDSATAITSTSKYKKEIIKLLDYIYSDEGSVLMNFGIEGKHYKMENGNPVYTDLIMKNPEGKSVQTALFSFGINRDVPMKKDIRYENQLLSEDAKKAVKMYEPLIKDPYPTLKFNDSERDVITSKYTEIKTYKDEMIDKFIGGNESMDKFDDFVKKIKQMGIDDVIKVHEDALKRYNQN